MEHLGLPDVTWIAPTPTHVLEHVFALEPIKPDDVLCDVGCGDGRVIAWWLSQGLQNRIIGLELDPSTALSTSHRFERYSNVRILHCDATHMLPVATVFYLYNPFTGDMMRRFADQIMRQPHAKVIYYNHTAVEAFEDGRFNVELKKQTRDDRQYRVAIIRPRRAP